MAGSDGAVITANSGRGLSVFSSTDDYRVVLPALPSGIFAANTVFLHCDVTGRPYRVEHFRAELERLGVMKETAAIGAYQMNHLWMLSLHSAAAKKRLVEARELTVKDKRCLVIDPDKTEVRLKVHWVPFPVPDDALRRVFEPYGKVQEISRDTWRAEGFQGIQSSTRVVRLDMKQGVTIDSLSHQLKVCGGNVLIVAPGRAPLCLRCKRTGHIRKDCRTPRCQQCRRFGHVTEDCVRTYAAVTDVTTRDEPHDFEMDEDEAEATARSEGREELQAPTGDVQESLEAHPATEPAEAKILYEVLPDISERGTQGTELVAAVDSTEGAAANSDTLLANQAPPQEATAADTVDLSKMDDLPEFPPLGPYPPTDPQDKPRKADQKWKGGLSKIGRFSPMPRIPPDDRRRPDPS